MRTVLIPTKLDAVAADVLRENDFEVVHDPDVDLAELAQAHPDAYGLIVRSEKVTPAVIDALPKLKIVVRAGSGYDNIDIKHARRKDVDVMNTPGANANAVAEEVITLALAAFRHVPRGDGSVREGRWEKKALMGRELAEKTVGIVGLGNIGQLVARRLTGFDNHILAFDPVVSAARAEDLGVELVSLESLFEQADVVTLHVPATEETRGMVDEKLLALMKPGAMLINCARAEIVDEDALRQAKAEKQLVFCNDVYDEDGPGDKSVADLADVMLPHLGASTAEANYNAAKRAADQLVAYVQQGVTSAVVNRGVPPGLDEGYQILAFQLTRVARAYAGPDLNPRRIETSFYGGLEEYANWLLAPVVLGLSAEFDPLFSFEAASDYLAEKGIAYDQRSADDRKRYGKSITIDLFHGKGSTFSKVSVRGTLTEGRPMVARIDDFDRLYFEPAGISVMVVYRDKPGMLAKITTVIARHGINIVDIRAPQDLKSGNSMAVLKVEQEIGQMAVLKVNQVVTPEVLDEIVRESGAIKAVSLQLK